MQKRFLNAQLQAHAHMGRKSPTFALQPAAEMR
jgi:hypothetical protein